jgi:hypothetical protein
MERVNWHAVFKQRWTGHSVCNGSHVCQINMIRLCKSCSLAQLWLHGSTTSSCCQTFKTRLTRCRQETIRNTASTCRMPSTGTRTCSKTAKHTDHHRRRRPSLLSQQTPLSPSTLLGPGSARQTSRPTMPRPHAPLAPGRQRSPTNSPRSRPALSVDDRLSPSFTCANFQTGANLPGMPRQTLLRAR